MNILFFAVFLLISEINARGLESPIKASIPDAVLPNVHQVDLDGLVFRGMSPVSKIEQLSMLEIDRVLIFKNQTKNEVRDEINILELANMNYLHIPFQWKDIKNFKKSCLEIVDGLKYIRESVLKNERVFFHCTVGEDRTGILAGLFRMIDQKVSASDAFSNEMCERGYGSGNPYKPIFVVNKIRKGLTPLFIAMSQKIQDMKVNWDSLSPNLCNELKIDLEHQLECPRSSLVD